MSPREVVRRGRRIVEACYGAGLGAYVEMVRSCRVRRLRMVAQSSGSAHRDEANAVIVQAPASIQKPLACASVTEQTLSDDTETLLGLPAAFRRLVTPRIAAESDSGCVRHELRWFEDTAVLLRVRGAADCVWVLLDEGVLLCEALLGGRLRSLAVVAATLVLVAAFALEIVVRHVRWSRPSAELSWPALLWPALFLVAFGIAFGVNALRGPVPVLVDPT